MLSLSCLKAPTLSLCPGVQARPFLTAFGALCGKWATHPVTPSPAHSRHPHTLSQPHWGCALFPKHSASGFGHVGPLTQHASRMPLHLFKSRSFLGLLSSDAASVRKRSRFLQAELLSPLPFSFQTVCAWLSPTFSIRMCILENTCIFPHYVTLLALGPSHSGQKYPGGIPESPGHDSRVPLAGSAAAFPCEMFLESVTSPLS